MLQLRRLLREQLLEALLAPMRRSRRRGRRGIASADGARRVVDLAACQAPPATPQYTPTPLEPPGFELPRTRAARRGALPFYDEGESSYVADEVVFDEPELAPPPPPQAPAAVDELGIAEPAMAPPLPIPPPPPVPARRNATAAANRRPGLRRFIPTGHVPAGATSRGLEGRPPRSGEGEA